MLRHALQKRAAAKLSASLLPSLGFRSSSIEPQQLTIRASPRDRYAKYFSYAQDRTAADIKELSRRRKWRIKIRAVEYDNHADMSDFFVQARLAAAPDCADSNISV